MLTIRTAIEKLQKIDVYSALVTAVEATKDQYAELNKEQMAEGRLSNSGEITPPYSAQYAAQRRKMNLQTDHVDLKRTGAFYGGYTASVSGTKIDLGSTVSYEKYLSGRYSEKIFGLTNENMAKYRAIVQPLIMISVKEQFHG